MRNLRLDSVVHAAEDGSRVPVCGDATSPAMAPEATSDVMTCPDCRAITGETAESVETATADPDARFTVSGYSGIAWYVVAPETAPDEDTEWSGYEVPTGNLVMTMVGDDRRSSIDPDDITRLPDDGYCAGCGQVGCTADGRDREDI